MDKVKTLVNLGISRSRIEKETGIAEGYLSRIFLDNRKINTKTTEKISNYYNEVILTLLESSGNTILINLLSKKS